MTPAEAQILRDLQCDLDRVRRRRERGYRQSSRMRLTRMRMYVKLAECRLMEATS